MKLILTEQQIADLAKNVVGSNPLEGAEEEFQKLAPNLSKLAKYLKFSPDPNTESMISGDENKFTDVTTRIKEIPEGGGMLHPLGKKTKISSDFGYRDISVGSKNHKGVDLAVPSNSPVYAPLDGLVVSARDTSQTNPCGGFIRIEHDKLITKYCHLSKIGVKEGQRVRKGQIIGYTGGGKNDPMKGVSTGPHLHYEILSKDTQLALNPVKVQSNLV